MKRIYDMLICLTALSAAVSCGYHTPVEKASSEDNRGQDASPGSSVNSSDASLSLPLAMKTIFNIDHEHGCSQSFENRGFSGTMTLAADSDGLASFDLEYRESMVFGPSVGRQMEGDRDYTYTNSKHLSHWSGRARPDGAELLFEFNRLEASSVNLPRYVDLPLPSPATTTTSFTLRCRLETVDTYPSPKDAGWAMASTEDGETSTPLSALACEPSLELFDLVSEIQVSDRLVFSEGDGLLVSSWTMWWDTRQVIRLAPPTSPSPDNP